MGTHQSTSLCSMSTTIGYAQKKKDDGKPTKCALCDGAHPANFKGLQVYPEIVSKRYLTQNGTVLRGQKPLTQHLGTEYTLRIPQVLNAMQPETLTHAQVTSQQFLHRNDNTQSYHPLNDNSFIHYVQQQNICL